jgi:hypothetical protein
MSEPRGAALASRDAPLAEIFSTIALQPLSQVLS